MAFQPFKGFVRITLRPEDKRRVFVLREYLGNCTKFVGVLSLAKVIWIAKSHRKAIEDASEQYVVGTDKKFVFPETKDSTYYRRIIEPCLPIDYCVEWLLKHCHKSALAQKRLKAFIGDDWPFIPAIFERIEENKAETAVALACKQLMDAFDATTFQWKLTHSRLGDCIELISRIQPTLTLDTVESSNTEE